MSSKEKSEAHFMCGQSLRESGALKESIEEFNKVLNVVPDHVKVCLQNLHNWHLQQQCIILFMPDNCSKMCLYYVCTVY